ncbi:hypothetical protein NSPZN2_130068 [Nitrospira defluvii]|uniref:Uncharacterized protein n=1 Tax=Nitrospira defluvii TaxID=330214 RepID=A0ABM8R9J3_9BACT|nr:hypothetical protein NSPZN2_130068 [Nitrospira defluvii]
MVHAFRDTIPEAVFAVERRVPEWVAMQFKQERSIGHASTSSLSNRRRVLQLRYWVTTLAGVTAWPSIAENRPE